MSQIEKQPIQPKEPVLREIEKVNPEARGVLEAADRLLRSEAFSHGHYGMLLTEPDVVTVGVHIKPSDKFPDQMYDIEVDIKPHNEKITPDMYGGTQVALNEGAVPSKNDAWVLVGFFKNENTVKFGYVPKGAVSKMRFMFPEEREQRRAERLAKNRNI